MVKVHPCTIFDVDTSNPSPVRALTNRCTDGQTGPILLPPPLMWDGADVTPKLICTKFTWLIMSGQLSEIV